MRHLWLGVAADITMDITPPTRWRTGGLRQSVDRPRPGHTLARRRDQARFERMRRFARRVADDR